MVGLAGYDGSLYREWVLNHPEEGAGSGRGDDEERVLSYHGYTQDTGLLLEISNTLSQLVSALTVDDKGNHPDFRPTLPPGAARRKPQAASLADQAKAFFAS